jgi:hypothetical protein
MRGPPDVFRNGRTNGHVRMAFSLTESSNEASTERKSRGGSRLSWLALMVFSGIADVATSAADHQESTD